MVNTLYILLVILPIIICLILLTVDLINRNEFKTSNSFLLIEGISQGSRLKNLNTSIKIGITLVSFIACFINRSIGIFLLFTFLSMTVSVIFGRVSLKTYFKLLFIPLTFLLLSSLAVLVTFSFKEPSNVLFGYAFNSFGFYITKDRLKLTIQIFLRSLAAISCLYFLIVNTPVYQLLSTLRKLHCPVLILDLMLLIYRFIFVLFEIAEEISRAAHLRLGFNTFRHSLRSFGLMVGNLFIIAIKRVNDYYNALELRHFSGEFNFLTPLNQITIKQWAFSVIYFLYLILILWLFK